MVRTNNKSKSKAKEETQIGIRDKMNVEDFMPKWAKEEKCFKEVVLRDSQTKKLVEGGWPRLAPTHQLVYENWLDSVVDKETGEYYAQR